MESLRTLALETPPPSARTSDDTVASPWSAPSRAPASRAGAGTGGVGDWPGGHRGEPRSAMRLAYPDESLHSFSSTVISKHSSPSTVTTGFLIRSRAADRRRCRCPPRRTRTVRAHGPTGSRSAPCRTGDNHDACRGRRFASAGRIRSVRDGDREDRELHRRLAAAFEGRSMSSIGDAGSAYGLAYRVTGQQSLLKTSSTMPSWRSGERPRRTPGARTLPNLLPRARAPPRGRPGPAGSACERGPSARRTSTPGRRRPCGSHRRGVVPRRAPERGPRGTRRPPFRTAAGA